MGFNNYRFAILLRLVLIIANCYGVTYLVQLGTYHWTLVNAMLLLVLQVFFLFRFLTRWQRDVSIFANSVKHGDYSITYNLIKKNDPHVELYGMLNNVSRYVRQLKVETEQQNQYFKYVVENAQVGLIAYNEKRDVLLINKEALQLLRLSEMKSLDDVASTDRVIHDELINLGISQPRLIVSGRDRSLKLSARRSKFVIDQQAVNLLSLINIRPELEENELRSWQDLISVLTHEIMNSITPIHSLNGSMVKYLDRIEGNTEVVSKAKSSLEVINRRSQALMTFVDRYRKISTVPLPRKERVDMLKLVQRVMTLLQNDLEGARVINKVESLIVLADTDQIEQVLINLIKNSLSALRESLRKEIEIKSETNDQRIILSVVDSGKGIPADVIDKIFVPFFTTREGGSGIGLTVSRQIMQRHGGSMEVKSDATGTTIRLLFPKDV